jgi:hypothetical protein
MEDIFMIQYHKTSYDSLKYLINLISLIKQNNKKFIITSHSTLPEDIIKESVAYIFDADNKLICQDPIYNFYTVLQDGIINSPFLSYGAINHKSYGLAAFKNTLNGFNLAKQLGYNIVHVIDYDVTPDFEDIQDNVSSLLEKDKNLIAYEYTPESMHGCIYSIKFNDNVKTTWDWDYWKEKNKNCSFSIEHLLLDTYTNWFTKEKIKIKPSLKHIFGEVISIENLGIIESVLFEFENELKIYIKNLSKKHLENIEIYSTSGKQKISLLPYHYNILILKKDCTFIDIIHDEKIYRKWDISTEDNYNKFVKINKYDKK